MNLLIFFVVFVMGFVLRMPVAFGMLASSTIYMLITPGMKLGMIPLQVLSNLENNFTIIAIPLFVFMAQIMNSGKITDNIFEFANAIVGKRKGGLAHVNIVASLIFSGMTGSAAADASGLGAMEIRAMRERGYSPEFSCAVTAASATMGPIFPPSIPMIYYAMISGTSIGALFLGGMVPGILMAVMLMIYVSYISHKRNYPVGASYLLRDIIVITLKAMPALCSVVILLGGIYSGIVTATEAGALASLYAILVSIFVYRAIGKRDFLHSIQETIKATGSVAMILATAYTFSFILAKEGIPVLFMDMMLSFTQNRYIMLLIINVVFLILGMFIDTSTINVIFVPIMLPLVSALGIDLVHFGVMIVINTMIGLTTPPFGLLLFITSGISGVPLAKIIKEVLPMVLVMIIELILVAYVPGIVTYLPSLFN